MTQHPELSAEQEYFDVAAEHRERRRKKALNPQAPIAGVNAAAAAALRESFKARAAAMGDADTGVAFWRLTDDSGDTLYIGRFPIFDEAYEPLVISWKADQAARFPEATRHEPLGVKLKRYFTNDGNTIADIADEWLIGELSQEPTEFARDTLLRALAQHRDGRLNDIVTTIEQAQDNVMRAPSEGILVVQGGPGTGKTVIGLQRISLLAYREQLDAQDLLFVGPSAGFLQYIGRVLPTLGDEGVSQLAITSLAPFRPQRIHSEDSAVARTKGDGRMSELLGRALRDRRGAPDSDTLLEIGGRTVTLTTDEVWEVMKPIDESGRPHNVGRDIVRERLIELVVEKHAEGPSSSSRPDLAASEIRNSTDFNNFHDRVWPTFSPQEFLRDLLASERRLRAHRWGLFEEEEILRIARPPQARIPDEPWSAADLALMDEAEGLLNGVGEIRRFQHVVVDEAQDLSPMQLRAIARRRAKGITVLGDLAQATGPWAHRSWDEVTSHLGSADEASFVELEVGYRVPKEVMAVAERVAAELDLPVKIPDPVRESGIQPSFIRSGPDLLIRAGIDAVRSYLADGLSVGLIVSESSLDEVGAALRYERLQYGDGRQTTTKPTTLVSAGSSKGLEFDAVVIVEPAEISGKGDGGLNELFVAITRTTGGLTVVHEKPLPPELEDFSSPDVEAQHEAPDDDAAETVETDEAESSESAVVVPSLNLADDVITGLVTRVTDAVHGLLSPEATEEFLEQLAERLRGENRPSGD